jgi:hypothetical protein
MGALSLTYEYQTGMFNCRKNNATITVCWGSLACYVQEANIKWWMSLLASTLVCMGSAILPFRTRLIKVLDEVFRLPSKVS